MERTYKHSTTWSDGGFVREYAQKYKYDKDSQTEFPSPRQECWTRKDWVLLCNEL